MSTRLEGRRVLVTGASSGIGAATARAVTATGGRVALLARSGDVLGELAAELDGAVAVPADVTDRDAVDRAVVKAAHGLDGLDAVVNCAGLALPSGIVDADPEDWRRQLDVNVLGLLQVTQACLPHLFDARPADVVNLSSMSGRRVASWQMGVYSATKFAVHALSEGLRKEVAPRGVRVTVVSPGYVDTPIFDGVDDDYATNTAEQGLSADAVAEAIVHALVQPPEVQLHEIAMTSMAQFD